MTPPINSEISKKLRAAIRAKLEELGVYVDDELPDYIMVMIANKKEKKQMKDDLTLFLSKNTDAFVEWLFDIFHRLQSVPAVAPIESKAAPSKEVKKEKTVTKEKKKVVGQLTKKTGEKKDEKAKKKVVSDADKEKEREREKKEKREQERKEIERANREDRERRDREEREKRDREERKEREERDRRDRERERKEREQRDREREEERQKERERQKRRDKEREERDTPPAKRRPSPIRARRALSPDDPVPSAAVRRRVSERTPVKRNEITVSRDVSPPPVAVQSKVVVKRQIKSNNDKGGAKGASSMFLRAMNAASVSAGYGGGGGALSRKRAAPSSANNEMPVFSDEDEFANGDMEDEEEEEGVIPVARKKAVPAVRRVVQPTIENIMENIKIKEPKFIVTFNKKEEEGDGKRKAVKRGAKNETEDEDDEAVRVSSAPRKTITVNGDKRRRQGSGPTDREDEDRRKRLSISVSPPHKHSSPTDWNGQINLNDDETSDEEAAIDAMLAATRASRVSSRGAEMERLPPTSQLSRGNSYYEPYDPSQPAVTAVINIAPQGYVPTPLSHTMGRSTNPNKIQERCKFFPNCKEGDACIYLHPATRHCTNFPRCSFGSRCMYTHPKCKFDASCNNPSCQFSHTVQKKAVAVVAPRQTVIPSPVIATAVAPTTTTPINITSPVAVEEKTKIEPDVPLVAAPPPITRPRVPSTLYSTIPCRFAAACTKPDCGFKHPTECRFGQNCRNNYCYYYHPPAGRITSAPSAIHTPTTPFFGGPSKMKWSAASTSTTTKTETA